MKNQQDQGVLFENGEMESLQAEIIENYRPIVKKNLYVFVDDEDEVFESVPEDVKSKGRIEDDLFDLSEIDEVNKKDREKKLEIAVKEAQKKMVLPYFENPKDHNEKLMNYQHDFIKNDDVIAYAKLLELSNKVCKFLIWAYLKKHKDIYLDEISQDEKASIAMEYVLRRYKYNVGWYVRSNFIGALKGGVRHAMEYQNTTDMNTICVENPILERTKNKKKKAD